MNENTVRKEIDTIIAFPKGVKLTNRQIDNRLRQISDLKAKEKELADLRASLEKEIQTSMGDTEHLETANFRVHFSTVKSNRFDSKQFKADHKVLYAKYTKEQQTRRFSFSTI